MPPDFVLRRQQQHPSGAPACRRIDVETEQHRLLDRREAHDGAVMLGHQHGLAAVGHGMAKPLRLAVSQPGFDFVRRVGTKAQGPHRGLVQGAQYLGIGWRRRADREGSHDGGLKRSAGRRLSGQTEADMVGGVGCEPLDLDLDRQWSASAWAKTRAGTRPRLAKSSSARGSTPGSASASKQYRTVDELRLRANTAGMEQLLADGRTATLRFAVQTEVLIRRARRSMRAMT